MSGDTFLSLLNDPTIQTVAGGAGLLGAVAGGAGAFAVVRRKSLQGDTVSHAALPGVAVAYLVGATSPVGLVIGGAVAGWLSLGVVAAVSGRRPTTFDTALAIVLATFFGAGLALKSYLQHHVSGAASSGLDHYLVGQAAFLQTKDILVTTVVGLLIAITFVVAWHRLALVSLDPEFATTLGISVRLWSAVLTTATVAAAVVGLQAVGVVLMSALLVAPAVAAGAWTHRLERLVPLAAAFGGASGVLGTVLSLRDVNGLAKNLPTGPAIVLTATAFVLASVGIAALRNRSVSPKGA